jgi:hypothetical protein
MSSSNLLIACYLSSIMVAFGLLATMMQMLFSKINTIQADLNIPNRDTVRLVILNMLCSLAALLLFSDIVSYIYDRLLFIESIIVVLLIAGFITSVIKKIYVIPLALFIILFLIELMIFIYFPQARSPFVLL